MNARYQRVTDDQLKKAQRLILYGMTVKDACIEAGFNPNAYFFRKKRGTLPRVRRTINGMKLLDLDEPETTETTPAPGSFSLPNLRGKVMVIVGDADAIFSGFKGML